MPLQPVMKLKVDQMFLQWFHLPGTQEFLEKISKGAVLDTERRRRAAERQKVTTKPYTLDADGTEEANYLSDSHESAAIISPCSSLGWGEFGKKSLTPSIGSEPLPTTPPISPRSLRPITNDTGELLRLDNVKDAVSLRKTTTAPTTVVETQLSCDKTEGDIQRLSATKLVFTAAENHTTAAATIPSSLKIESKSIHPVSHEIDQIEEILTQLQITRSENEKQLDKAVSIGVKLAEEIISSDVPETVTVRSHKHPVVKISNSPRSTEATKLQESSDISTESISSSNETLSHQQISADSSKTPASHIGNFPTTVSLTNGSHTIKRRIRDHIPTFYHKYGTPTSVEITTAMLERASRIFAKLENERAKEIDMPAIMTATELPLYWKRPVFLKCLGSRSEGSISYHDFSTEWQKITKKHHDEASIFVALLACGNRDYLIPEDFEPLIQDIVESHPGLSFLREAKEFHVRYIHTVIARIWFSSSRPWHERLEIKHLRKSNLLKTIRLLEQEEDINQITNYFSYEHFYVIYCKFWELDKDHDLLIDMADLARHNEYALSSRIIKRIFSGAVRCEFLARLCKTNKADRVNKMTYPEFVWFLIAEEDKRQFTSIEYWFRCMDKDGDGVLSFEELQFFYSEQTSKLDAMGIDTLPFTDCLCQILDMIKPHDPCKIRLADLKRCKMTPYFFDTFFNVDKYLEHEQRDPNASFKSDSGEELSDWERFAAEEYEILVNEDGMNNNNNNTDNRTGDHQEETEINCDEDDEIELPKSALGRSEVKEIE